MFREQEHTQSAGGTYALGIIPRYFSDGRTVYEHNGTLTGWNAQLVIEPESGNGIAVVSNSDKAYYMTYELMEVWSRNTLGECVFDPLMKQMKNAFQLIKMVMFTLVLLFGVLLTRNMMTQRYYWKNSSWKVGISVILFLLLGILDIIIFYTDQIGSLAWGMENYYLFTFFPPDFLYIQMAAGILVFMLLVRINLKKRTVS